MNLFRILCSWLLIFVVTGCSPKADSGAKFLGHWVEKVQHSGTVVALDITDAGNGNYLVTEFRRYSKDMPPSKWGSFPCVLKDGNLTASGKTIIVKSDGSLFYDKDFVR